MTSARPGRSEGDGTGADGGARRFRIAGALLAAACVTGCQSLIFNLLFPIEPWPEDRPLRAAEGFSVERIYHVPREEQGSWVSLTVDPRGRLIASDQEGALYRITPPPIGGSPAQTRVERLDLAVGSAHGLLYAFDSLYVVVNRGLVLAGADNGVHRLRDTNGDDRFDEARLLRKLPGHGEHGPHQLVVGPDGQSLFFVGGNMTPPLAFERSRVPRVWQEDRLLPVMSGLMTQLEPPPPGGWVARLDPDGREWELQAIGFRNPYDLAFNRAGDLFVYDADMEWDVGAPWYRPTRLNHVVSGGDYGWRRGSGKWPDTFPDSLGSVVDVGTGSPTGIAFGYGAAFPERYEQALFLLDWSHGKIYAAHLTSDGASYRAELEPFVVGQPLPLTDVVINPLDGALYFTTGGRRADSGIFRVTYVGDEAVGARGVTTAVGGAGRPAIGEANALRRRLEALHEANAPGGVELAWSHLAHAERSVRHAARVALEHQPPALWRERALAAGAAGGTAADNGAAGSRAFGMRAAEVRTSDPSAPDTTIAALLALARVGDAADRDAALASLLALDASALSRRQRLDWLRAASLWIVRHGRPGARVEADLSARLLAAYPADSFQENRELGELLVHLDVPQATAPTVALLQRAPTQEEQIAYAQVLANARGGWTPELRGAYFDWFERANTLHGGQALDHFVERIEETARAGLSSDERAQLAARRQAPAAPPPPAPKGPGRAWTLAELEPALADALRGRDFENGRDMFRAGACFTCHRFDGRGGALGPDLSSVGGRYGAREIAESIVAPSRVVSDQYQAAEIHLKDGSVVFGRVVNVVQWSSLEVSTDMQTSETRLIPTADVARIDASPRSMMPPGLIDAMNEREVLDLLAYLISGGAPEHPAFR